MTLSITLEPDVAAAAVQVTVRESGSASPLPFTLTRTDANGVAPVRLLPGQGIGTGALIVTDTEATLAGTIGYTAAYSGGGSATATTVLDAPRDVLSVPVMPQYRAEAAMTTEISAARRSRSVVHEPVGRRDPVVTLGALGLRTGRFAFTVRNRAEAASIEAVAERAAVLHLRFAEAVDRDLYFTVTDLDTSLDNSTGSRVLTITYAEVIRPTAALAGALGWTFEDVTELDSFLTVRDRYATFADLTAGRPS